MSKVSGTLRRSPDSRLGQWSRQLEANEAKWFRRSKWIISLLSDEGEFSPEHVLSRVFDKKLNTMTRKKWHSLSRQAPHHLPTALYMLFRAYLTDARDQLDPVLDGCHTSRSRLIRDAALVVDKLQQGASRFGTIKDMPLRKEQLLKLGLSARCKLR